MGRVQNVLCFMPIRLATPVKYFETSEFAGLERLENMVNMERPQKLDFYTLEKLDL